MREFMVRFCSFEDIQEFVTLAGCETFPIFVGNDSYQVNGTSFMGMFTLDHTKPVRVVTDCTEEEFNGFRQKVSHFLEQ